MRILTLAPLLLMPPMTPSSTTTGTTGRRSTGASEGAAAPRRQRVCAAASWDNGTCLPTGVVVSKLPGLESGECCAACSKNAACVAWNVNHQQQLCFLRGDWKPVPGPECTASQLRPSPPPTPLPPAPPPPPPPPPPPTPASRGARNVLFMVSDDMRPELGAYGSKHVHSPNLDALASDGMLFERAYIMVSLCMPSRTAFLTSRRPGTTKNYVIGAEYWRSTGGPNATSLPQRFKEAGYRTIGMVRRPPPAALPVLVHFSSTLLRPHRFHAPHTMPAGQDLSRRTVPMDAWQRRALFFWLMGWYVSDCPKR